MPEPRKESRRKERREVRREIRSICSRISKIELVASGHVRERTTMCGKPGCSCADNPAARHGPYCDWSRLDGKKLRQTRLTPKEAEQLREAIRNHAEIRRLLKRWEELTWALIRGQDERA